MCQEFPKEKWIDAQKENVLDAPYYHVVFTVPEELNSIIYSNQKLLYDALYHAASATLFLEVGLMMKINGKKQVEIFFSHMVSSQRCSVENIWMS